MSVAKIKGFENWNLRIFRSLQELSENYMSPIGVWFEQGFKRYHLESQSLQKQISETLTRKYKNCRNAILFMNSAHPVHCTYLREPENSGNLVFFFSFDKMLLSLNCF